MSSKNKFHDLILSAMLLALALVLPFLTGQIPRIGNALCPMHLPVFLCGFFCGPWYAAAVGFVAPYLRLALFGMPPLIPAGVAMCFELTAYGFVSGSLYRRFERKKGGVYLSLLPAMLSGRAVWGAVRFILYGLGKSGFGWSAFLAGAFLNAFPGIAVQIVLIPVIVTALKKNSNPQNP